MGQVPQRQIGRVEQDRRSGTGGQVGGGADVIVVRVGADDRSHGPVTNGLCDRGSVMRGVDHDDLGGVTDDPDVVVDVPGASVEGEGARREEVLDHKITTERSTSPRRIASNASVIPSRLIVSLTKASSASRPCLNRSMSIGKSREGRQSPYHDDFSAPPRPNTSCSGSSSLISGVGTHTRTTVPARSRAENACL